jgi:hypothetical protein
VSYMPPLLHSFSPFQVSLIGIGFVGS